MYKILLSALLITLAIQSGNSQNSDFTPKEEFGIRLTSATNFALMYKKERKDGHYNRFDAGTARVTAINNDQLGIQLSVRAIKEKRKQKSDQFFFNYGPGVSLNTSFSTNYDSGSIRVIPAFVYLLGAQYRLSKTVYIGFEIFPSAGIDFGISSNNRDPEIRANINFTNSASLNVAYQFAG